MSIRLFHHPFSRAAGSVWMLEEIGDTFSMADVIFGGTLRYMLRFGMLQARPTFAAYAERLGERPALQKADAINAQVASDHGLG